MQYGLLLACILVTGPAYAHFGDHAGLYLKDLAAHVFEPDHILFAIAAVIIGIASYRAGRRAEARMITTKEQTRDPR